MKKHTYQLKLWTLITGIVLGILSPLMVYVPVHAATDMNALPNEGEWIDQTAIYYHGAVYRDTDIFDKSNGYTGEFNGTCFSSFEDVNLANTNTSQSAKLVYREPSSVGNCQEVGHKFISLLHSERSVINAYKVSDDTFFMPEYHEADDAKSVSTQTNGFFKKLPSDDKRSKGNEYWLFKDGAWPQGCQNGPSSGDPLTWIDTDTWMQRQQDDNGHFCYTLVPGFDVKVTLANGGNIVSQLDQRVYGQIDPAKGTIGTSAGAAASTGAATNNAPASCESNNSTVIIGWLLCAMIGALDGAVNAATTVVNTLLSFNGEDLTSGQGAAQLHNVWSLFRAVASFALIAVALVMIIGQTLGGE